MHRFILCFFFCFTLISLHAEKRCVISGFVRDSATGEELIGATIRVSGSSVGCSSNNYGYYSLSLPPGKYTIEVSYVGYMKKTRKFDIKNSVRWNIELDVKTDILEEVRIVAHSAKKRLQSFEMGTNRLTINDVKTVPVLFGEQDLLKTLQLMPGVKPAGEGINGFYVRGGTNDQNLILLDEAPVYNASHLMGFFSIFNNDAIKDARLIKGIAPAEYGGRLSSVLDIKMKNGNNKSLSGSGGIGAIASRLTLEFPFSNQMGSLMVSGRRTYADLFLKLSPDENINNTGLYFYDLNIKSNCKLSSKDRLFLSGYIGRDVFEYNKTMNIDWGNKMFTLRWNHVFSEKLFLNTTFIYSNYDYKMTEYNDYDCVTIESGIKDLNLKIDFQYYLNYSNTVKFGANVIRHGFLPGKVDFKGEKEDENDKRLFDREAVEASVYLSNDFRLGERVKISAGVRFSDIRLLGEGVYSLYDGDGNKRDTKEYKDNELVKYYWGLEPRLSVNISTGESSSVKAGFSRNIQNVHLVSNTAGGTPFDIWYPVSRVVKPQKADLFSVGYFKNYSNGLFETSVETYYKNMYNQIEYKNGADIFMNEDIDGEFVFGKARAYGVEFMLKKNEGNFNGWVAYTLSRVEKKFGKINGGAWFPGRQDRTHDFSVVAMFKMNKKLELSANWLYYTGDAVTFPSGRYRLAGNMVNLYAERNADRMPDYHRLDLGLVYRPGNIGKYQSWWTFSLYNAYGRDNAFMMYFRENKAEKGTTEAVKISLFSVVPSVTWNFRF